MFFCNKELYAKISKQQTSNEKVSIEMPFQKLFITRKNILQNSQVKKYMPCLPLLLTEAICMLLTYFVQARLRMTQDSKNLNLT